MSEPHNYCTVPLAPTVLSPAGAFGRESPLFVARIGVTAAAIAGVGASGASLIAPIAAGAPSDKSGATAVADAAIHLVLAAAAAVGTSVMVLMVVTVASAANHVVRIGPVNKQRVKTPPFKIGK